jgi:cytochrome c-type biogenesis protein CcmH
MFWAAIGVMLVAAVLTVAVPLYRRERKLTATSVAAIAVVTVIAAAMYAQIGTPHTGSTAHESELPAVEEMVSALAARLQENPDDVSGWKMLGRSYLQMQNFPAAIEALEKAVDLESAQDGQTLADLGEAVLMNDNTTINGRAGQLFENALALSPGNQKALFYSGLAAVQRGDNDLAATRWEALLATSPPPNIQEILRQRIAELRGLEPGAEVAAATPAVPASATDDAVVTVGVSLGEAAQQANLPDSTVFIIVRDPNQPAPPIAAVRRRLSELPATISIGDSDAMIPGRVPSAFDSLEVIARVALGGQPVAQPGDWFGEQVIDTSSSGTVGIVIDQQVP